MSPSQTATPKQTLPARQGAEATGHAQKQALPEHERLAEEALLALREARFDEAETLTARSLEIQKTAAALILAGRLALRKSGPRAAINEYKAALKMDPQSTQAHMLMADAYFQQVDSRCLYHAALALKLSPDERHHKDNFIACTERFTNLKPSTGKRGSDAAIKEAVHVCLETPDLNLNALSHLWFLLFANDSTYNLYYRSYFSHKPNMTSPVWKRALLMFMAPRELYVVFDEERFRRQKDLRPLCTPFFLNGLRHLKVPHIGFEAFLTKLRRRMLESLSAPEADIETNLALSGALALYCMETDYIFNTEPEEQAEIDRLRRSIEAAQDLQKIAPEVAVYASYAPLSELTNAEDIRKAFATHTHLKDIIAADIEARIRLNDKKAELASMSGFENDVSIRVRGQYEEFPYPRWKHKPIPSLEDSDAPLRKKGVKILIAGCGTGLEAASTSISFPDAVIEAIDLSTTSLAYAALKAEEFSLTNIRFRHGDLLHLDFPDHYFDAIFCHGVLHHMQDPIAGWKSLLRCLKPDGIMRIALYSEKARRDFVAAQRIIAQKGLARTAEAMKAFRRDAVNIVPYKIYESLINNSSDYYQLSSLRDLLFHEQEHRMTLPQIGRIFDDLGLKLAEFSVAAQKRRDYRQLFGDAPDTIDNWHQFEQLYPDTFAGMYQFWCRRDEKKTAAQK
ncbi:MAG: methyltransferase domain-containing protein [Alphaproteobacteria bacterium]|nr:methyltransferase domain-containing protein [Alphaproteobacteria bacterium]